MAPKIDLRLLKRFMSELESALAIADAVKADKTDKDKYIVEMSKAMGLVAGVVTEGTLLMGDLQASISQTGMPGLTKEDLLSRILGGKGPGNAN